MSTMFKIFVGNISYTTNEAQLTELVQPLISIEDVVIARDDQGRSKGYAFVLTRDAQQGKQAIEELGKPVIDGRRIYFRISRGKRTPVRPVRRPNGRRRPRPRPTNSGYQASDGRGERPRGPAN